MKKSNFSAPYYNQGIGFKAPEVPIKVKKIHDKKNNNNIGISLWTEQALQKLRINTGALAKDNEFQAHYWSLNFRREFEDGSIVDISIPTVFFNYKQKVSGAAIDFELQDVEDTSDAIQVLHDIEVNKLLPLLTEKLGAFLPMSVALNSIHRHPGGRSQGFSSTDLKTDHETDTGVVFPLASGDMKPNFASIMSVVNGRTYLSRTEYRLANGAVSDEKGITYFHGRSSTYVKAPSTTTKVSGAEAMFGVVPKVIDNSYLFQDKMDTQSEFEAILYALWDSLDYEPNVDFVKEENVSKKVYAAPVINRGIYADPVDYGTSSKKSVTTIPWNERNIVIKRLLLDDDVTIHPKSIIAYMSAPEKRAHMLHLEEHYYMQVSTLVDTIITTDEIMELQDDVVEEMWLSIKKEAANAIY